ncbi:imidazoleglycerol-phosphate dehydratase HisB [Thermodesulfatator autotrophicus]|uniref:Imidazoleglycerol-phosphate dehydratase n=1 Tax=Thermodesulfatator autotrophicus TaxID=1795632 RepID=A0A177E7M7_9BACT|nr:imidazoleglycerol-phosphate dehydratase HisB [Thermodesulfatator autotrophicus]OAG27947.1 imidazoleglycerol-phosphate dehydratase [Thermodesulfatator autotrophicus]
MKNKFPIEVKRKTFETEVKVFWDPYTPGHIKIDTGVGFLDHMLELLAVHGDFSLEVKARGDLHVDYHHTVEDVGLTLGEALRKGLGERRGISRYGEAVIPMEEALAAVYIDLAERPCFVQKGKMPVEKIGTFDTELISEFLKALAMKGAFTLHIHFIYGENAHHMVEAGFKALGHALKRALSPLKQDKVLSSKGVL